MVNEWRQVDLTFEKQAFARTENCPVVAPCIHYRAAHYQRE